MEKIEPDLGHNVPSPKMNSGIMDVHQNDPDKLIDNPDVFKAFLNNPKWMQGNQHLNKHLPD